jgi:trehalose 6-phosphate synthase/phosphatase
MSDWETRSFAADFDWKNIAEPVMKLYTEATDGSYIETKESALVWHHQDADPDFGSCQAKELLDHLENVLANDPVVVKRGQNIVEVKPQVCRLFVRGLFPCSFFFFFCLKLVSH